MLNLSSNLLDFSISQYIGFSTPVCSGVLPLCISTVSNSDQVELFTEFLNRRCLPSEFDVPNAAGARTNSNKTN